MMKWNLKIGLGAALCLFCLGVFSQMRELSFYEVKPAKTAPVLDGKLDDPAWQDLPRHTRYYEYAKPDPRVGKLKTEFMMTYDAKGLYLGIVNYDKNISKLKKNVTDHDNTNLWTDDCAELYFDPEANSIGFTKFTVNAIGTKADMRRLDAAVTLNDWTGSGWMVKNEIGTDYWTIEAFFPWEDLGKQAAPGDFWMFCHTRYGWADGFVGVTSAPGGSYLATDKFGYLYFSDGKTKLNPAEIGELLRPRAQVPWCIDLGNELVSRTGDKVKIEPLNEVIQSAREECGLLQLELKALNHPKLQAKKSNVPEENTLPVLRMLQSLNNELFELKWQIHLDRNFN